MPAASLRALLEGVIDYAGLFPPARLPLDAALPLYLRHRQEAERWMLSRFILPLGKMDELKALLERQAGAIEPVRLSVLLSSGERSAPEVIRDFAAIHDLLQQRQERMAIECIETRLSATIRNPETEPALVFGSPGKISGFFELSLDGDWRADVPRVHTFLSLIFGGNGGVKLRCGGLDAAAFPSCAQVAGVIAVCRDVRVPLKFTAGLHHPLRHFNASVQAKMHGFVNVFAAGVFAHCLGLGEARLQAILEDEDPGNFTFEEEAMRWRDCRATVADIRLARKLGVTSFGSCSFDEPCGDLGQLGLL